MVICFMFSMCCFYCTGECIMLYDVYYVIVTYSLIINLCKIIIYLNENKFIAHGKREIRINIEKHVNKIFIVLIIQFIISVYKILCNPYLMSLHILYYASASLLICNMIY